MRTGQKPLQIKRIRFGNAFLLGAISVFLLSLANSQAFAITTSGISYQGRILKPDGTPLEGANVQFRFQLRTPNTNDCLMYEEQKSLDMRDSNGVFALTLNDGNGVRTDTTGWGLDKIFANRAAFTFVSTTCSLGSSYNPSENDGRKLVVYFKDETMSTWEPMGAQAINYVPYAFEAKQISGFGVNSLLRFDLPDGSMKNTSPLSETEYDKLTALIAGTSTAYEQSGKLGGASLPTLGISQAGQVLSWNGMGWETHASTLSADSVTSANIVNGSIAGTDLATNIAINTTSTISTSGTVSSNVTTARDFRIYDSDASPNENYISIKAPASLSANYNYVWPINYGTANQVLTTDGTGALTWAAPAVSSQWSNGASNTISYGAGNVGIGTTAPLQLMHAEGALATSPAIMVRGSDLGTSAALQVSSSYSDTGVGSAGARVVLNDAGTGGKRWDITSGGYAAGALTFRNNSDNLNAMTIGSSGAVGIGTTAPNQALTLFKSGSSQSLLMEDYRSAEYHNSLVSKAARGTSAAPTFLGNASDGDQIFGLTGSAWDGAAFTNVAGIHMYGKSHSATSMQSHLRFYTTDTNTIAWREVMRVNEKGNVGIGMTAPSAYLNLKAGTATAGTAPIKLTQGTLLTTPEDGAMEYDASGIWFTIGSTRYLIPVNTAAGNYSNVQTIGNTTGSITMTPLAGNSVIINSTAVSTSSSTGALVVNGGVGIDGAVIASGNISSGGTVRATNNVVTPQIYGSVAASGDVRIDGTSHATAGNVLLASVGGKVGIGTTDPGARFEVVNGSVQIRPLSGGNHIVRLNATDSVRGDLWSNYGDLSFSTTSSQTERMRVLYNGNVGIGTTAPNTLLHVGGSQRIDGALTLTNRSVIAAGPNTNDTQINYNGNFLFSPTSSGYVGIGTTAPTSLLHVVGSGTAFSVSGNSYFQNAVGINGILTATGTARFGNTTNAANFIGNVGIGTTAPVAKLEVFDNASDTKLKIRNDSINNGETASLLFAVDSSSTAVGAKIQHIRTSSYDRGALAFFTNNMADSSADNSVERMRVDSAGNVGIGTTAPAAAAKLEVNGQIRGGFVSGSSLSVDWAGGNIQETNAAAGTVNFTTGSMLNGSTYTLILTTAGTFTLGTAGDITTWRCMPACPGSQITASGHTMLSIVKAGTTGYVSWIAGF